MVGETFVKVHCDTTELDEALKKLERLVALSEETKTGTHADISGAAWVVPTFAVAMQAEAKIVSRRDLLFWWRR